MHACTQGLDQERDVELIAERYLEDFNFLAWRVSILLNPPTVLDKCCIRRIKIAMLVVFESSRTV